MPSAVSAIKVDGVRAYQRVRDGQDVELQARPVTIHELRLTAESRKAIVEADGAFSDGPDVVEAVDIDILVSCSSGTYVRIAVTAGSAEEVDTIVSTILTTAH